MKEEPPEDFRKILEKVARQKRSILSVFRDFCKLTACVLAAQTREDEYLEVAKSYHKDDLKRFSEALASLVDEMQNTPFTDLLGTYYTEIGSKADISARGEFFTPKPVCSAMARMLIDVDQVKEEGRSITVNDPACGSGGIPLAVAERFAPGDVDLLRVTCQDISEHSCDMCYINMTMWGIPAKIIWGDSLRMTVENMWCSIHWFRVGEHFRERFQTVRRLMEGLPQETSSSETNPEKVLISGIEERSQSSFDF